MQPRTHQIAGLFQPSNNPEHVTGKNSGLLVNAATLPPQLDDVTSPTPVNSAAPTTGPVAIIAELVGNDSCSALGVTGKGNAPVLDLCSKLIERGVDPNAALRCYRGTTWALKVRSIGEVAALELNGDGTGFRPRRQPDAGADARQNLKTACEPPPLGGEAYGYAPVMSAINSNPDMVAPTWRQIGAAASTVANAMPRHRPRKGAAHARSTQTD